MKKKKKPLVLKREEMVKTNFGLFKYDDKTEHTPRDMKKLFNETVVYVREILLNKLHLLNEKNRDAILAIYERELEEYLCSTIEKFGEPLPSGEGEDIDDSKD